MSQNQAALFLACIWVIQVEEFNGKNFQDLCFACKLKQKAQVTSDHKIEKPLLCFALLASDTGKTFDNKVEPLTV